jgi:AraC-like DNA-binding protein
MLLSEQRTRRSPSQKEQAMTTSTETAAQQDENRAFAELEQAVDYLSESLFVPAIIEGDLKRGVRFYTASHRHMGASIVRPDRAAAGALVVDLRAQGYTMNDIVAETGMSKSTCRRLINEAMLADEVEDALAEADAVATTAVAA